MADYWYSESSGHAAWWNGWALGNDASHAYSSYCCPTDTSGHSEYTWLQVALPSLSGNITSALLYIYVLSFSTDDQSGLYAALGHTSNSSSATGDATRREPH
jgi:hypothetical protein